jgi:hypothetical protein
VFMRLYTICALFMIAEKKREQGMELFKD